MGLFDRIKADHGYDGWSLTGTIKDAGQWVADQLDRTKGMPEVDASGQLRGQSRAAGQFADRGQLGFQRTGAQMNSLQAMLNRLAQGQDSFSAEQLRQGLQQNLANQQSLAAGASQRNQGAAARTAAIQMGRLGAGAAGQQALAGIQERQAAQQALSGLLMGRRGQDLQAALQGRQNALQGLVGYENALSNRFSAQAAEPTALEKTFGALAPVGAAFI